MDARQKRPALAAAGVAALILLGGAAAYAAGPAGADAGAHAPAALPTAADVRAVRQGSALAVPTRMPPGLEHAWVSTTDGVATMSVHSVDAPVVTVCSEVPARCTGAASGTVIRTGRVDGIPFTVKVEASDDPAAAPLAPALADFWQHVELSPDQDSWPQG